MTLTFSHSLFTHDVQKTPSLIKAQNSVKNYRLYASK